MSSVHVSMKADEVANPVYHRSYYCGKANLLDDYDTVYEFKTGRLKDHIRIQGFERMFRFCDRCC